MNARHVMFGAVVAMTAAFTATAGVIRPIDPFTGDFQEGFETQERGQFRPSDDVFSSNGVVRQLGEGQGLHITTGWSFFGVVRPRSGEAFMGGAGVNAEWVFDVPAQRFGGYFTTNADVADAIAIFFDEDGNQLAKLDVSAPLNGQWAWNGWEVNGIRGVGIKRVQIIANNRFNGFIMHDDMEYTPIPAPGALALLGIAAFVSRRRRRSG